MERFTNKTDSDLWSRQFSNKEFLYSHSLTIARPKVHESDGAREIDHPTPYYPFKW